MNDSTIQPVLTIPYYSVLTALQIDALRKEWQRLKLSFQGLLVDLPEDADMEIHAVQKDEFMLFVLKSDYITQDRVDSFIKGMEHFIDPKKICIACLSLGEELEVIESDRLRYVMRNVAATMTDVDLESIGLKRLPKREDVFDINRSFA